MKLSLSFQWANSLVVGLDVGTCMVKIAVGELHPSAKVRMLGCCSAPSRGMRNGQVMDPEAAGRSIFQAIREAEDSLDVNIGEVELSVTGVHLQSTICGIPNELQSLMTCLNSHLRIPLAVAHTVFSGLASALAVVEPQDKKLGAIVLDLGAGTTDYLVYAGNKVRQSGVVPVGGEQLIGRENELLRSIHSKIAAQGMDEIVGGTVFLTGGCSRLRGLPELASSIFGMAARRTAPQGYNGLLEHLTVPEMAAVVGLIKYRCTIR